jgi:hypothetical protein
MRTWPAGYGGLYAPAMDIVRPEVRAFARADAEYRRRNNGNPIPAHSSFSEPYWGLGRLDSQGGDVDVFAMEEASALLTAAMSVRLDPERTARVFAQVPSAKLQRQQAASVPWWKRIFDDSAAGPPPVPVPIADLRPRAVPIWRGHATDMSSVYDRPIQTFSDLLALQPTALPVQTVSGGGAGGVAGDEIRS